MDVRPPRRYRRDGVLVELRSTLPGGRGLLGRTRRLHKSHNSYYRNVGPPLARRSAGVSADRGSLELPEVRDAARKSRREPPVAVGGWGSALSMDTRRDGSGECAGSARAMVTICGWSACASRRGGTTNRCELHALDDQGGGRLRGQDGGALGHEALRERTRLS